MTGRAPLKKSMLCRMADVASERGVSVWVEIDGYRFGVSPSAATNGPGPDSEEAELDRELEEFKRKHGIS